MGTRFQYLFGPVPSRRFGRSLGIDLTPFKTCSLDCVFCQLGRTQCKTVTRREYVPVEAVFKELEEWLETGGRADVITLSGSGEPTLHTGFGEVLRFIKERTRIPAVLLTNGTLLHREEVRAAALYADIVKVSLSAWDQRSFEWINRPHKSITFDRVLEGEKAFRSVYHGSYRMEVMVVNGMNSLPRDIARIAALAEAIGPDKIQLNAPIRPPAEEFASAPSKEHLQRLTQLFRLPAGTIMDSNIDFAEEVRANEETLLSMLRRRPCTAEQIAHAFGMHPNEVLKYLGRLVSEKQIKADFKGGVVYYVSLRDKQS